MESYINEAKTILGRTLVLKNYKILSSYVVFKTRNSEELLTRVITGVNIYIGLAINLPNSHPFTEWQNNFARFKNNFRCLKT